MSQQISLQSSLLDLADEPAFGELGDTVQRIDLGLGAWLDVRPGWLTGADALFEQVRTAVPWQAERRQMYDTVVDVPRMTRFYRTGEPLPLP
ncbi:MAG: alpha-ketoglutarate-dependent dioxygenase AlkB, partial [Candidatus Phosphoribacter baldrii]